MAVAAVDMDLRLYLLTHHHLLSAVILTLAVLILVPSRIWPVAAAVAAVLLWLLRRAMAFKERTTGLPITYLDVATNIAEPHIIIRALGYHGSIAVLGLTSALALVVLVAMLVRLFGYPSLRRLGGGAAESAGLLIVGTMALAAAGRDLRDRLPAIYPNLALDMWEASGQRELERRIGPLDYLAYTYQAGDGEAASEYERTAPPRPRDQIARAVRQYIRFPEARSRTLPNIVILHAESTFDPNAVFHLTRRVDLPLWDRGPSTASLGPMRVNVVGGGTWVTEFEVLTGADSRSFGFHGFYTHQKIGPRVRNALPSYLAAKGYQNWAFYSGAMFGAETAFRHYGFTRFAADKSFGLRGDWSDTDEDVIKHVIARGGFAPADHPRLLFISTLENHGPHPCAHFRSRDQFVTSLRDNSDYAYDCSINEYIRRARSTSAAVETVLVQLRHMERTTQRPFVLLIYGDHQPWSFTEGHYSVVGGTATDAAIPSFARFRRGRNDQLVLYHILSSVPGVLPMSFGAPVSATLLPTLISAYAASSPADLYLPENLFAFSRCGTDYQNPRCPLRKDMQAWTRDYLFG